jgi:hypothetical protein
MGSGFPLFFGFIIYSIAVMFLLLIIVGIYNLEKNSDGEYCELEECRPEVKLSQYNKPSDYTGDTNAALNLIFVIVGLISTIFMRKWVKDTHFQCDADVVSPADFTIMVEGLPLTETEQSIKEYFEENGAKEGKTPVRKVVLAYSKIEEYIEETKDLVKLLDKKHQNKDHELKKLEEEIHEKKKKLKELKAEYKFSGTAFVTFENEAGKKIQHDSINRL